MGINNQLPVINILVIFFIYVLIVIVLFCVAWSFHIFMEKFGSSSGTQKGTGSGSNPSSGSDDDKDKKNSWFIMFVKNYWQEILSVTIVLASIFLGGYLFLEDDLPKTFTAEEIGKIKEGIKFHKEMSSLLFNIREFLEILEKFEQRFLLDAVIADRIDSLITLNDSLFTLKEKSKMAYARELIRLADDPTFNIFKQNYTIINELYNDNWKKCVIQYHEYGIFFIENKIFFSKQLQDIINEATKSN